jgi:hypothetical protein
MKVTTCTNYADQRFASLSIGLEFSASGKQYAVSGQSVYQRDADKLIFVGTVSAAEKNSRHKIIEALDL